MTNSTFQPFQKNPINGFARFFVSFRKTFLWVLVIFILCFLPGHAIEKLNLFNFSYQDLIVHFIMYAVFTVLLIQELSKNKNADQQVKTTWNMPLIASALLGIVTELVQHFWIPGRFGSISDFILDMCGCGAAILVCRISWVRNRLRI
jgi:hypothetical protein